MGSEWPKTQLQELSLDLTVGFVGLMSSLFVDGGVPLLRGKNILPYRLELTDLKYISSETHQKWKKSSLKAGDVVIVRVGQPGTACVIPDGLGDLNAASLVIVRPNKNQLDPFFLCYFLNSIWGQNLVSSLIVGSVQQVFNVKTAATLEIPSPPITMQRAIAHVLGALDDRIELNRRMNETLESMAQALFKSWFVDFDPVIDNALASGKEIPVELSVRAAVRAAIGDKRQPLPAEIRTLFPDEFTDSEELGWIPKGWEVASFSKYAALNQSSWTKKNTPENVQYVDLSNTKEGKINLVVSYAFADAPSRARRILKQHDTIIGTVRPGNSSFAYVHKEGLTGSTGFAVMTPTEKRCRSFVYLGLTQDKVIGKFAHLADGAAYPAIRPEVVANFESIFPTADLIESFDSCVYPWIEQIGKHEEQAGTLAQLRNTLLPKLLSGEVRIQDVEKMVEELAL